MQPRLKDIVLTARPRTLEQALKPASEHEQYLELYGGITGEINSMNVYRESMSTQVEPSCNQVNAVNEAARQLQALNTPKAEDR